MLETLHFDWSPETLVALLGSDFSVGVVHWGSKSRPHSWETDGSAVNISWAPWGKGR